MMVCNVNVNSYNTQQLSVHWLILRCIAIIRILGEFSSYLSHSCSEYESLDRPLNFRTRCDSRRITNDFGYLRQHVFGWFHHCVSQASGRLGERCDWRHLFVWRWLFYRLRSGQKAELNSTIFDSRQQIKTPEFTLWRFLLFVATAYFGVAAFCFCALATNQSNTGNKA